MPDDDYKDKYLEEKFTNINSRLDTIINNQNHDQEQRRLLWEKVREIERKQALCPITGVIDDVKQLKKDTEDIRYYKTRPKQLRNLLYGTVFMALMSMSTLIFTIIKLIHTK